MVLEAGTLEPLRQHRIAGRVRLPRDLGDGIPEQRETFLAGLARPAIKLQPVRLPVMPESLECDRVPGFRKVPGLLRMCPRFRLPVPALLPEPIVAQPSEQDVVRGLLLGVELEAVALERLRQEAALVGLLVRRRRDRVAEDRQAAVLLPVVVEAALDAVRDAGDARETETRLRGGCATGEDERQQREQHEDDPAHVESFLVLAVGQACGV